MRYFAKEIPEAPVYIHGHPILFDFLATEDGALIGELDKCARSGRGGVMSITQEVYDEEIKKKENGNGSVHRLKPNAQRTELTALQWEGVRAAAQGGSFAKPQTPDNRPHTQFGLPRSAGPAPDPIEVPGPETFKTIKPPVAKAKDTQSPTLT